MSMDESSASKLERHLYGALRQVTLELITQCRPKDLDGRHSMIVGVADAGGIEGMRAGMADFVDLCIEYQDRIEELETEIGRMEAAR